MVFLMEKLFLQVVLMRIVELLKVVAVMQALNIELAELLGEMVAMVIKLYTGSHLHVRFNDYI
jgi:hypothetical protein